MTPDPAAGLTGPPPPPAARLQAVLFDMDGLLVDSEGQWFAAEYAVMARLGGTWDAAQAEALVGSDLLASGAYLARAAGSHVPPGTVTGWLVADMAARLSAEVRLRPGALDLLAALAAAGVPTALVSASYRVLVDPVLARVRALLGDGVFATSVAGDEVHRGKPDPLPYRIAMDRLGVDPAGCVVLEDSRTGVAAGEAAGALVVAVPDRQPVPPGPGRVVVASLTVLDPARLAALLAAHHATTGGTGGSAGKSLPNRDVSRGLRSSHRKISGTSVPTAAGSTGPA